MASGWDSGSGTSADPYVLTITQSVYNSGATLECNQGDYIRILYTSGSSRYGLYSSTAFDTLGFTTSTFMRLFYIDAQQANIAGSDAAYSGRYRTSPPIPDEGALIYLTVVAPIPPLNVPVNVDGTYKDSKPYVNVDGTWKEVSNVYTNVDGTWKEI